MKSIVENGESDEKPKKEMFEIANSEDLEPVPVVRVLLLALIRKSPESSGYDLMKAISDFTNGSINLSSGTVYTTLRRLEKNGSVNSSRESIGRRRRAYKITKQGEIDLFQLVAQIEKRVEVLLNPIIKLVSDQ